MNAHRHRLLKLALAVVGTLLPLQLAASSQAATLDPLGFQIQVPAGGIVVHENAGAAVITVTRDPLESVAPAQVRYITSGNGFNPATNSPFQCGTSICTATSDDFTSVKGQLNFDAGQQSATFQIPITDHGYATSPKTFQVSLFGPSPIGLGPVFKSRSPSSRTIRRRPCSPATRSRSQPRRPEATRSPVPGSSSTRRARRPTRPSRIRR